MKKLTRGRIRAFLERFATDELVLDIGSGGSDQDHIFPNRTTFDIDPARGPQVVGDAHTMPFEDGSYGLVLCSEVLEHLTNPPLALKEMRRVLRPGGVLVLTTRFAFPVHDAPGDYFRYTPEGLRHLLRDWEIIEEASENDAFGAIAVLLQRIIFQTELKGGKITKGIVWGLASILDRMDGLILKRYGEIQRTSEVPTLLTSGVYIACRKPAVH